MNNKLETFLGLAIILIATAFLIFTYKTTSITKFANTYTLKAKFDQIDGIVVGSDLKISGIKIGTVINLDLDLTNYNAIMTVAINNTIKLPEDSSMKIVTNGLFGNKYVDVSPGAEERILRSGDEIKYTQSSINLEGLISKLIFSLDKDNKKS